MISTRRILLAGTMMLALQASAQELFQFGKGGPIRAASFENPTGQKGAAAKANKSAKGHAFESLKAGSSVVLMNYKGSGVIRRIWLTVSPRYPEMLRSLTISIFWDGETKAAVQAPLGDFFGIAHGQLSSFESALFSNPEGLSFNCIIPMPFQREARVILTNESDKDVTHVFYEIHFAPVKRLPKDTLYFHTYWNRRPKVELGKDYEVLPKLEGKGRFIGCNIGVMTNPDYEDYWWGEGEVKMYIDGDKEYPTMAGTGAEDYAGAAWGLGKFSHRYQGCPVSDAAKRMWSFYRFHIPDPVFFEKDIKVTIQDIGGADLDQIRALKQRGVPLIPVSVDSTNGVFTRLLEPSAPKIEDKDCPKGWVNIYRQDDFCAAAYFYYDKPTNNLPPLPSLQIRTARLTAQTPKAEERPSVSGESLH